MENEQVIDLDFDLEAFEAELIKKYGSLEAALIDLSDRPE
jgi:hypothetical protein